MTTEGKNKKEKAITSFIFLYFCSCRRSHEWGSVESCVIKKSMTFVVFTLLKWPNSYHETSCHKTCRSFTSCRRENVCTIGLMKSHVVKFNAIFFSFLIHSLSLTLTHSHEQSSGRRPCKKKRSTISTAKCKQTIDVSDKE